MNPFIKATTLTLCCLLLVCPETIAFAWKEARGCRSAELSVPTNGKPGFASLPPESTGIYFTNWLAQDRNLTNQILLNGSGVAAGDVDGDGWCDLYFCGLDGSNQLYRNLGNWKFQDITAKAGVAFAKLDATGAVLADIDGDGDLDLLLNSLGAGTFVYLNDGKAHFTQSPLNQGLNAKMGGMSLALADMDGDGDLDVYLANYRTVTIRDQPNTRFTFGMSNGQPVLTKIDGREITDPDLANRFNYKITLGEKGATFAHDENGEPDVLYGNDAGRLVPVSFTDGSFLDEDGKPLARPPFDWGLSVMFRDLNGDGAPDIYVCNDFKSPDRVWLNDGKGKFRAMARLALRQTSLSSMGVDVADINRDGYDDILVVDMLSRVHSRRHAQRIDIKPEAMGIGQIDNRPQYPRNTLLLGRGDGTFAEVAQLSGLEASEWSWTPVFLDVDLDGYEDVLISNGFERDGMNVDILRRLEALKKEKKLSTIEQLHLRKLFPRLVTPNFAFRNLGNLKFQERSADWGFNAAGISHGMALADLDHDGDLDLAVNNLNSAAGIYRNDCSEPRLAVQLKGQSPNTHGIGAKIKVSGGRVVQSQEIVSGGRYLSCDEAMRVFAAGPGEMTIEVIWRSGKRSVVNGAKPNHVYEIEEESGVSHPLSAAPPAGRLTTTNGQVTTLFADVSALLGHTHHEEPFDDFARQPLLPNRLSQAGPGVAWFDLDGDGWEDLLIGSGRGGQLAAYRNDGKGGFKRLEGAPFTQPVTRDQTALLGWHKSDGRSVLLAGSANYEDGLPTGSVARQYDFSAKVVEDVLPGQRSTTGPLAMADIDGDGDLDLFIGGRVVPGRYPEPASSMLLRQADGKWIADPDNGKALADLGLVSGAVFSDIDGDGDPDLILASEWDSLKIFRNEAGKLNQWNPPVKLPQSISTPNLQPSTLNHFTGWWNGVATGDFDGDGRLDIIAANWGQNSRFESFRDQPLRMFYGDVDGDGTVDVVESYTDAQTKRLWPLQPFHLVSAALPSVAERLGAYASYAAKNLHEIYGPGLNAMKELSAIWLESTLFLNRGDHFEARPLPVEAQMSPAFAVCVGDVNGDGNEDVFLSQNFFATQPDTSRYDAGRGLWLKGDGQGGFQALAGQDTGVKVYGEQRGAALCDYDGDGRVDLAVTQNGAETKLYKNVGATPGLRVRLEGPTANSLAVGARVRLITPQKTGPVREIHAGAGYWSQDGAVQVIAAPGATQIWIRWPGGKTTTSDLPPGARELSVDVEGNVKALR